LSPEAINATDKNGNIALHYAAARDMKEVCELLLSTSPEAINITDKNGNTTLHAAALGGHKGICELLISKMRLETINAVNNDKKNCFT